LGYEFAPVSEASVPPESRDAAKPRTKRGPRGGNSVQRALAKVATPTVLANPDQELAWEKDFLGAMRTDPIPKKAAEIAGINMSLVFRWRRESERFEELYQRSKEEGVENTLEAVAFERAKEKSDLLMLGALNAYMPQRYKRDNAKTTRFAGNGIVLEISDAK
jgi:hypothetical protein